MSGKNLKPEFVHAGDVFYSDEISVVVINEALTKVIERRGPLKNHEGQIYAINLYPQTGLAKSALAYPGDILEVREYLAEVEGEMEKILKQQEEIEDVKNINPEL